MKKLSAWQVSKPMPDLSIRNCLNKAEAQLNTIKSAKQLALVLIAHALHRDKTWVLAHDDYHLKEAENKAFLKDVQSLVAGKPLPYITGKQSFYGLDFLVNESVLIPRPETEQVIEEALKWLRATTAPVHMLDIGTGSACIAISLLKNAPDLTATAIDISEEALAIAQKNAENHTVSHHLTFLKSDLLNQYQGSAQLICANLPYIPSGILNNLSVTDWEPRLALDGGMDGLDLIRRLLAQSHRVLKKPALILLEIEATTGNLALQLARKSYPGAETRLLKDLAGHDRLIRIEVKA